IGEKTLPIVRAALPRILKVIDSNPATKSVFEGLYTNLKYAGKVELDALRAGVESPVATIIGSHNKATSHGVFFAARMFNRLGKLLNPLSEEDFNLVMSAKNNPEAAEDILRDHPELQDVVRKLTRETNLSFKASQASLKETVLTAHLAGIPSEADRQLVSNAVRRGTHIPQVTPHFRPEAGQADIPLAQRKMILLNKDAVEHAQFLEHHANQAKAAVENTNFPYRVGYLPSHPLVGEEAARPVISSESVLPEAVKTIPRSAKQLTKAQRLAKTGNAGGKTFGKTIPPPKLEGHRPYTYNELDRRDLRGLAQTTPPNIHNRDEMMSNLESMAQNAGVQKRTALLHRNLGVKLASNPEIRKLFEKEVGGTGSYKEVTDQLVTAWDKLVTYPRAGLVATSPRHAINISVLAANTIPLHLLPKATADVSKLVVKLMKAGDDPLAIDRLTKVGQRMGAFPMGHPPPMFQKIPVLSAMARWNNRLVWAVDIAWKQVYALILHKTGEVPDLLRAGGKANQRLVDYYHTNPLSRNILKHVDTFSTYRGQIPGAVLGGIARNPARAGVLNDLSQHKLYGTKT
ncbi:MAG: hypothetical protein ACREQ5_14450, partial [Candidatus Dormibacteria bacterium]